jgi:tetratricopeptide (TPR) repeat protein
VRKTTGDALVGTDVAHYVVEARLGGGGMGVVYAARDTKLGRRVALKFLPPQWSHDESAKQRFMREAQAASATDHPNICTIHDIGTTADGQLFIVMAHYNGQTLKARLEGGRLPVDEAVDIAAQVAEGLAKAHSQGVVHRDIKPGNLMLTEDGVRILDFGLAKFADARLKLTLEGSTIGTIAYMAPEQARGDEADARSDIWAVGVVLYEMLIGEVPFKGGYPEAISHAIKNDPPAPIRPVVPEVPEALEQLVFRTLYKERAVRIQSARELARSLRLLQGRTLPIDLRTEALPQVDAIRGVTPPRPRWWRSRRTAGVAATLAVLTMGMPIWIFSPVDRVPVAVAPVVNQTGYAELDAYRMALTRELVAQLADSGSIRVLPYDQLRQIIGRFQATGHDVSSREAMQALTMHSGAQVIVVPTLLYENGAWRARVEFRRADTATGDGAYETAPVVSSLIKDTAYGLMPNLADGVEARFLATGPTRAYVAHAAREFAGWAAPARVPRLRTLDAAASFEQGLEAYDGLEYAAALRTFASASEQDPRNPLIAAWRSRVAMIMRRDTEAAKAAEEATGLLHDQVPEADRMFVEAVANESRRNFPATEAIYRELASRHPDDVTPLFELAAFLDRRTRNQDAIVAYQRGLDIDDSLARPEVELCRLYNRSNEGANARNRAQRGLMKYQALGYPAGEAQALFCLADTLRSGSDQDREQARRHADAALKILQTIGADYQLSRAYYYVALVAGAQGRRADAAAIGEQSLEAARKAGNLVLEPLVLMNLGVTHEALGNRARAADYYQQSYKLYESLGDEPRAAQIQANRAALLIQSGLNAEEGLRDLQNALAVFRKIGDRNFEVFAAMVTGAYHRYAGRHGEAERELNRGLAIARERDLNDDIAALTLDRGRTRFEVGDYAGARKLLQEALGDGSGPRGPEARIRLAIVHTRLGDFARADAELMKAATELEQGRDRWLFPLLHTALGAVAYETGRSNDARRHFGNAVNFPQGDPDPDGASIEARASLGLLDALEGRAAAGRGIVAASLVDARKMGRYSLEARLRIYLARIDVGLGRFDDALETLRDISADGARALGPELQAQVHYWRGRALLGQGDRAAAQAEASASRQLIESLRAALPAADRDRFALRPDIRSLFS